MGTFLYKIYDTKTEEWIPGEYHKGEVQKMLNTKASISEWAHEERLIRGRWKVKIIEKLERTPAGFAERWDEVVGVLRGSGIDLSRIQLTLGK